MYEVGEKVIYSDMSPWETAIVVSTETDDPNFDYVLDFQDGLGPLAIQSDGMRKYTPENVKKYLGKDISNA